MATHGQTSKHSADYTVATLLHAADTAQGPHSLNNFGNVIRKGHQFVSTETGGMVSNGTSVQSNQQTATASGFSRASAINDAGEVAGVTNTADSLVPLISSPGRGTQRIPLLPGDKCGQAFSINQQGNVAGYSSGAQGVRAFLWIRGQGVQNLGTLPGATQSKARDVNNSDQVVGTVRTTKGDRAVLWTNAGSVRDLGTLPGDTSSEATAINNSGAVVGYSNGPRGTHAFLWTRASGMQDLGTLSGGNYSRALDINDPGDVVGASTSSVGDRAFVWRRGAGMQDLNEALSNHARVFVEAHAINNKGQILVMGIGHESATSGGTQPQHPNACAPAPEATYLLTPAGR
jgi:probable HAF family extracellular repeat protein